MQALAALTLPGVIPDPTSRWPLNLPAYPVMSIVPRVRFRLVCKVSDRTEKDGDATVPVPQVTGRPEQALSAFREAHPASR